ncbi:MAG: hypothetical protein Q8Q94_04365 [bacterium]|nr:hypothetical protein [bacterium]MDZ4299786.1 hypothetical protein [Candidatus Sungbacteria bacterium]
MPEARRLSDSQLWLLENVATTSARRADRRVKRARLSAEQQEELAAAIEYLQRDEVRIVINADLRRVHAGFSASVIEGFFATRRLLNRFEIEQAQQNTASPNMTGRIMEEFLLYGATPDIIPVLALLSAAERPHYGALDFLGDPRTLPMLGFYGPYRLRLKKEAVNRSTFTAGSIPLIPSSEVYVWKDIRGVLVRKFTMQRPPRFLFEYVNNKTESVGAISSSRYIEAQILGGVHMDEDVDRMYFPAADRFTDLFPQMERLVRECNIELVPY